MEIRKFKYEILDFGNEQVFRAENDDAVEAVLDDLTNPPEEDIQEIAEEALKASAQEEQKEEVAELPPEPTFSAQEMEVAKNLAKEDGVREGSAQAKKEAEEKADQLQAKIAQLLESINAQLTKQAKDFENKFAQIEKGCSTLSLAMAKKVIGEQQAASIEEDMIALISDSFAKIGKKSGLILRLHPEAAKALEGKFDEVELVEDEAILPNDFKIEWQNGFAQRKTDEIWRDLEQCVNTGEMAKVEEVEVELPKAEEEVNAAEEGAEIKEEVLKEVSKEIQEEKKAVEEKAELPAEEIIEEDNNITNENNNKEE